MAAKKLDVSGVYADVRNPDSGITWAVVECEEGAFTVTATGTKHVHFMNAFEDDKGVFGFIRITENGADSSSKFILVTWVGRKVPPLGRAKMVFDRSALSPIVTQYDDEIKTNQLSDLDSEALKTRVFAAAAASS